VEARNITWTCGEIIMITLASFCRDSKACPWRPETRPGPVARTLTNIDFLQGFKDQMQDLTCGEDTD
jgi:hypothetical protein